MATAGVEAVVNTEAIASIGGAVDVEAVADVEVVVDISFSALANVADIYAGAQIVKKMKRNFSSAAASPPPPSHGSSKCFGVCTTFDIFSAYPLTCFIIQVLRVLNRSREICYLW